MLGQVRKLARTQVNSAVPKLLLQDSPQRVALVVGRHANGGTVVLTVGISLASVRSPLPLFTLSFSLQDVVHNTDKNCQKCEGNSGSKDGLLHHSAVNLILTHNSQVHFPCGSDIVHNRTRK